MTALVLASDNHNKLREIKSILQEVCNTTLDIFPQSEFEITTPEETGSSFFENALLKAQFVANQVALPVIAEDSGLEVTALSGEPGIYSARYAGENASDQQNLEKLLDRMKAVPDTNRVARFCCTAVYLDNTNANSPKPQTFNGYWEGQIAQAAQGKQGFGYDPIFYVAQHNCTAAELPAELKNRISHRTQAFTQFAAYLNTHPRQ